VSNGNSTEEIDEAAYVARIEERFQGLRGAPLFLSPEDFQRALRWREMGIPLFLVLDAMEQVFRRAAETKPRRAPRTLAYCEPAVLEAHAFHRERMLGAARGEAAGDAERDDAAAYLAAAVAVEASGAPAAARADVAARLRRIPELPPLVNVDRAGALARDLGEACLAALAEEDRAALVAEARAAVAPYAAAMADDVRARAERTALERLLRVRFRLPDLTLLPLR